MGKNTSPGPVYMLPPTVGFPNHDFSRYRNPQYSISPRLPQMAPKSTTPGPVYQVRGLNQYGKKPYAGYTLQSRPTPLTPFNPPGPGTYSPEKGPRTREPRPPAYSIQGRNQLQGKGIGPGPCAYGLPSMLGPKVPNKPSNGAYTIMGRNVYEHHTQTPGPANYQGINANLYKNRKPAYSLPGRLGIICRDKSPGPAAYLPGKLCGEMGPKFTMGYRFDNSPYVTAEDSMPCHNL